MEDSMIKPKCTSKCKVCRAEFIKRSMTHRTCKIECALALVATEKKRKEAKVDKVRKEALKSLSDLKREAQTVFNAFIRERDKNLPCISCGRSTGGKINAGHYLSVGSHPQLRYHEQNCWLQCEYCNTYKSGNQAAYRIELVKRIGLPFVEALESDHEIKKWTREELVELKLIYREKLKKLKIV
jgi:hypothetical protein